MRIVETTCAHGPEGTTQAQRPLRWSHPGDRSTLQPQLPGPLARSRAPLPFPTRLEAPVHDLPRVLPSVSPSPGILLDHTALYRPQLGTSLAAQLCGPQRCIGATNTPAPPAVHWSHPRHAPAAPLSSFTWRGSCWSPHVQNRYQTVASAPHLWEPRADDATRCLLAAIRFFCIRAPPTPPAFFVRSRGLSPVCCGLVLCLPPTRSVPTCSTSRCAVPPRSGTARSRTPFHTFVSFFGLPPQFSWLALPLSPPFGGFPVGQHVAPRRLPHAHYSPPTGLYVPLGPTSHPSPARRQLCLPFTHLWSPTDSPVRSARPRTRTHHSHLVRPSCTVHFHSP